MVNNHSVTDIRAIVTKRTGLVQKSSHVSQRRRHCSVFDVTSCTKTDPPASSTRSLRAHYKNYILHDDPESSERTQFSLSLKELSIWTSRLRFTSPP